MSKYLILILDAKLKVVYIDRLLPSLDIKNVKFKALLNSDFIGFYDWLRTSKDQICGVRLTPFDFAKEIVNKIQNISYSKLFSQSTLEVYFKKDTSFISEISCDQDFGSVKIYVSEDLKYAIGFDIENLTLQERQSLDLIIKE